MYFARIIVPRTCQEYANLGITRSGRFPVDPDGSGIRDPAIKVTCDMNTGMYEFL
jgi:hypothetical protein